MAPAGLSKRKSLSSGRPPTIRRPTKTLPSTTTRSLIRSFHQLQKARAQAVVKGDDVKVAAIDKELASQGGLERYQDASINGQSVTRGGDTSRVLISWLHQYDDFRQRLERAKIAKNAKSVPRLKLLEIGALSPSNECSQCPAFDVTRIDLHSQHPLIEQQDFMERPLPKTKNEKFDVLSLSLVLNFVPEATRRGEMLQRTCEFLRQDEDSPNILPALFLVLPAACVTNSRYLTEGHLEELMSSLGYSLRHKHISAKLIYCLYSFSGDGSPRGFPKTQLNPGSKRNNFSIIVE